MNKWELIRVTQNSVEVVKRLADALRTKAADITEEDKDLLGISADWLDQLVMENLELKERLVHKT